MSNTSIPAPQLRLGDFLPFGGWDKDVNGIQFDPKDHTHAKILGVTGSFSFFCDLKKDEPLFTVDKRTGHRYINIPKETLRKYHLLNACFIPSMLPFMTAGIAIKRLFRVISFYHFRHPEKTPLLTQKLKSTAIDIALIALSPIIAVGYSLSLLYGLVAPYDGEKMATLFCRLSSSSPLYPYPLSDEILKAILTNNAG